MADDLKKILEGAKAASKSASDFSKSVGDSKGMFAPQTPKAGPKPPVKEPPKPNTGIKREAEDAGKGIKARMENEAAALGSFKKGGTIPKTGLYQMHKDEKVIPADKAKNTAASALGGPDAKAASKPRMSIEPTDNDGYVVRHDMKGDDGMPASKIHAIKNTAALISHMKEHYKDADASQSEESAEG